MTVNQLRELLRQSGLTVSGKKADLIKRLQYSARAKKALISPSCSEEMRNTKSAVSNTTNDFNEQKSTEENTKRSTPEANDQDVQSSVRKSVRKRPVSRLESTTSTKRLKICQETISSSLRKRSPVASSATKVTRSQRRISPSSSALKSKKTPPSRIQTRSKRISPSSANSNTSSSNRSTRATTKTSTTKTASQKAELSSKGSKQGVLASQKVVASSKENKLSVPQRVTRKRSDPLSTITNSAKKRKSDRRASMKKSVNKALLQLEEQLGGL